MNIFTSIYNKITGGTVTGNPKSGSSLKSYITDIQMPRIKVDVLEWRASISEAERAYFPFRYKQQRIYVDTILNGHTKSCWERRKDLTLLRDFRIVDANGNENEDLTVIFKQIWFTNFLSFVIDAQAFGYSLVYLGDVVDSAFKGMEVIKRWNISPDRYEVASYPYMPQGRKFLEEDEIRQWHIYVPTKNDIGTSPCGYGILYEVAVLEIYLRSTTGFSVDYSQNYGQPIRVGKTTKTNEDERAVLFQSLVDMGNNSSILLDIQDEIDLVESKGTGQGYKVYEYLSKMLKGEISKIILGHADALDSTPGKLGAGQGGEESPTQIAMMDKQTADANFVTPIINEELIPRMRELGFSIPEGFTFEFKNDDEKEAFRKKQDASNQVTAEIFKTIKDAGGEPDWEYFTERTGIKTTKAAVPAPVIGLPKDKPAFGEKIAAKLQNLYK